MAAIVSVPAIPSTFNWVLGPPNVTGTKLSSDWTRITSAGTFTPPGPTDPEGRLGAAGGEVTMEPPRVPMAQKLTGIRTPYQYTRSPGPTHARDKRSKALR